MKPFVIWMTGLSGSGKSTIAKELKHKLQNISVPVLKFSGDDLRSGLSSDLNFSRDERNENNRRAAEIAKLAIDNRINVICALISPLEEQRRVAKEIIGEEAFIEVHVDAPLILCEAYDGKGLYAKARAGEIKDFTGISSPYEPPNNPDIKLPFYGFTPFTLTEWVIDYLVKRGYINAVRNEDS